MSLTKELREGIDKYIEATGQEPKTIQLTPLGVELMGEDGRVRPKHIMTFDGIPIEFLGPESPRNIAFLLK